MIGVSSSTTTTFELKLRVVSNQEYDDFMSNVTRVYCIYIMEEEAVHLLRTYTAMPSESDRIVPKK